MFRGPLPACLLSAGLLFAGALAPALADQPEKVPAKKSRHQKAPEALITVSYQVADLVVPLDNPGDRCVVELPAPERPATTQPEPAPAATCSHCRPSHTLEDQLIKLITTTVAPQSWDSKGGRGTIDYYPLGMALVINQTPDVQEQVAELLAALRRLQDIEVAVEVRFIATSEPFERIGIDFNGKGPGGQPVAVHDQPAAAPQAGDAPGHVRFLDDAQLKQFMEFVQGDARTNVMQAPKLTVLNGQAATINITDRRYFVTGVNPVQIGDQVAVTPKNEAMPLGLRMSVQPVVSADRRSVYLNLKINQTELASGVVPLFPVAVPVKPVDGDKEGAGKPVVMTQFIQQPTVNTIAVDQTLTIPDGGTALLSGWTKVTEGRTEFGPPVLSKVPYVNRLFRNQGCGRETQQVCVLVTPRLIVHSEEEKPAAREVGTSPCPKPAAPDTAAVTEEQELAPRHEAASRDRKVALLLKKYREACAAGDLPQAKKYAVRALILDPSCFSKQHADAGR
jgi:type II secretory pathway component GspD/PulD (secretin)